MDTLNIQFYYPSKLVSRVNGDHRKEKLKPFLEDEILPRLKLKIKSLDENYFKFSILKFGISEENLSFLIKLIFNKERNYFPYAISCDKKYYPQTEKFLKQERGKNFYLGEGIYGKQFNFRKVYKK